METSSSFEDSLEASLEAAERAMADSRSLLTHPPLDPSFSRFSTGSDDEDIPPGYDNPPPPLPPSDYHAPPAALTRSGSDDPGIVIDFVWENQRRVPWRPLSARTPDLDGFCWTHTDLKSVQRPVFESCSESLVALFHRHHGPPPSDSDDVDRGVAPGWRWLSPWLVDNSDTFGIDRLTAQNTPLVTEDGRPPDWLYADDWPEDKKLLPPKGKSRGSSSRSTSPQEERERRLSGDDPAGLALPRPLPDSLEEPEATCPETCYYYVRSAPGNGGTRSRPPLVRCRRWVRPREKATPIMQQITSPSSDASDLSVSLDQRASDGGAGEADDWDLIYHDAAGGVSVSLNQSLADLGASLAADNDPPPPPPAPGEESKHWLGNAMAMTSATNSEAVEEGTGVEAEVLSDEELARRLVEAEEAQFEAEQHASKLLAEKLEAEQRAAEEQKKQAEEEGAALARRAQGAEGVMVDAFTCPACMDEVAPLRGIALAGDGCNDGLCAECFERLARSAIESKQMVLCPCCKAQVPGWLIRNFLTSDIADSYDSIEQMHLNQVEGGTLKFWYCPSPDCSNRRIIPSNWDAHDLASHYSIDKGPRWWARWRQDKDQVEDRQRRNADIEAARVIDCETCKKKICAPCNVEDHTGISCDEFQKWKADNEAADESFTMMIEKGLIKPCPNCAAPILKNEGCNFMTCSSCNSPEKMCWKTGKPRYGPNGCGGGHQCH